MPPKPKYLTFNHPGLRYAAPWAIICQPFRLFTAALFREKYKHIKLYKRENFIDF